MLTDKVLTDIPLAFIDGIRCKLDREFVRRV